MQVRRVCAVIGSPIGHSRSPDLHNAAYRNLGMDWSYLRREVRAGELAAWVDEVSTNGLDGAPCGGLSVTMPGKAEALARADEPHPRAQILGAANTLVPRYDDERLVGWTAYNTDVDGIVGALTHRGLTTVGDRRVVIIGAGGTAAAAVAAAQAMGAHQVAVIARNHQRAMSLVHIGDQLGCEVTLTGWANMGASLAAGDVIISTVPPGVADEAAVVPFTAQHTVLDAVYAGGATALQRAAVAGGATVVEGVDMLLFQAVEQVRLMTGREPSVAAMRAALG